MVSELEASMVDRLEPPMDRNMTEILMVCLMEHRTARLTKFDLECSKDGTSKGPDDLRVGSIDGRPIRTTDYCRELQSTVPPWSWNPSAPLSCAMTKGRWSILYPFPSIPWKRGKRRGWGSMDLKTLESDRDVRGAMGSLMAATSSRSTLRVTSLLLVSAPLRGFVRSTVSLAVLKRKS